MYPGATHNPTATNGLWGCKHHRKKGLCDTVQSKESQTLQRPQCVGSSVVVSEVAVVHKESFLVQVAQTSVEVRVCGSIEAISNRPARTRFLETLSCCLQNFLTRERSPLTKLSDPGPTRYSDATQAWRLINRPPKQACFIPFEQHACEGGRMDGFLLIRREE